MLLYRPELFEEWREKSSELGIGVPDSIFWKDPTGIFSDPSAVIKTPNPLEMCVEPYLARVEQKQRDALDTLQCAYVSHSAPAFESGTPGEFLRAKLIERRTQLLSHPARFQVHLADVVDSVNNEPPNILSNYRAMLKASGVQNFGPGSLTLADPDDNDDPIGPQSVTFYAPPPPEDDPEQEQEDAPPLPVPMAGTIATKPDETIPDVESDRERRAGLLVPVAIAAGALALTRKE